LKVKGEEIGQIKRLSKSNWVLGLSDAVLKSLDEPTVSRMMSAYLYFKSNGRPNKDFLGYIATKELWSTMAIGLNVLGAAIPAMIFDKEFRTLAMKTGVNKGLEMVSKSMPKKVAKTRVDQTTQNLKQKIRA
jgi:hypothetical protein